MLLVKQVVGRCFMETNKRTYGLRPETKIKQITEVVIIFKTNITAKPKNFRFVFHMLYNSVNKILKKPNSKRKMKSDTNHEKTIDRINLVMKMSENEKEPRYENLYFSLCGKLSDILKLKQRIKE